MESFNVKILLKEGSRDKALEMFMPYLQKRGINMSISQLKQYLLNKFVSEAGMHSLSLESNFYLLGVARYYFNGDLTTNKQINILYPRVKDRFNPQVCQRLDALVEILRNSYVDSVGTKWEQPEDFGNLSIDKLLKKYNAKINKALGIDTKNVPDTVQQPTVSDDYTAGSQYTYEILYSYEDAKKYNSATEPGAWCITYGKAHYDGYIKRLNIHYVVFAQKGYQNIPRKVGAGFTKRKPHDAYGNSLICVLQSNKSPKPIYITSRWNHGSYADGTSGTEADHAYTPEEFLQVIGCDYSVLERAFEQWKVNSQSEENKSKDRMAMRADRLNAMRQLKYAQMLINGGTNPFTIQTLSIRPIFSDERNYLPGSTAENHPYNPKGLFWVRVRVNDNETFETFMDRKQIMFDKYLVSTSRMGYGRFLNNHNDKYMSLSKPDGSFMVYDRVRRRFLDLDGVITFPYGTSQFKAYYDSSGYKYGMIAMSGNQLALVNLNTLKPVRARNGSPWFETIVIKDTNQHGNRDYRGHIDFPCLSSKGDDIFHMVYDSASGEDYWFNSKTDSFADVKTNVPEGFVPYDEGHASQRLPGRNYMMFYDQSKGKIGMFNNPTTPFMFKNLDTNEVFTMGGEQFFLDFEIEGQVIGARPVDSEYAYYGDWKNNSKLTLNGQPVLTKYRTALQYDDSSGYNLISLSRWYTVDAKDSPNHGELTYGDFYKKVLLYNPYTHDFYYDKENSIDGSGYVFYWYGSGTVIPPVGKGKDWRGIDGRNNAYQNGWLVKIPNAKDAVVQAESKKSISNIIREEIDKLLSESLGVS